MQQLAPAVWAHVIDAEGFPTLSAVVLTPRRAIVVDTLTGPRRHATRSSSSSTRRPATAAVVVVEHAPPLGPRVRQRRLPGRGHRRAARLPAPHPGGAAGRRRVAAPAAVRGRPAAQRHLRRPAHVRGRGRDRAPHPHARPQRGLAGRVPRREPPAARRRHGRVAAAQLLASATGREEWVRTLRQLKQLPADLVVPAHGPAMDKQHHRRQRALRDRRLRGGRRGQGRRRRAAARSSCRRSSSSPAASRSTRCTQAVHRENLLWAWDEV